MGLLYDLKRQVDTLRTQNSLQQSVAAPEEFSRRYRTVLPPS